jgi:hypothetical protein
MLRNVKLDGDQRCLYAFSGYWQTKYSDSGALWKRQTSSGSVPLFGLKIQTQGLPLTDLDVDVLLGPSRGVSLLDRLACVRIKAKFKNTA